MFEEENFIKISEVALVLLRLIVASLD